MKVPLPEINEGRTLTDRVTYALRKAILTGYFEPGEKLDPHLIAQELDVSRMPVREALRRLESERLVETQSHRGTFIRVLSRRDIDDLFDVRKLLEVEVVRLVTPLIPPAVLNDLETSLNEELVRLDRGDSSRHYESDDHFHKTLLALVENRFLREVLSSFNHRISLVRAIAVLHSGPHLVTPVEEHIAIVHAMRNRDAAEAANLMALHLENSKHRFRNLPWVKP